ncbi:MAG: hypothetical protein P8Z79_14225 [Sedimentisphaerales bacterium]
MIRPSTHSPRRVGFPASLLSQTGHLRVKPAALLPLVLGPTKSTSQTVAVHGLQTGDLELILRTYRSDLFKNRLLIKGKYQRQGEEWLWTKLRSLECGELFILNELITRWIRVPSRWHFEANVLEQQFELHMQAAGLSTYSEQTILVSYWHNGL